MGVGEGGAHSNRFLTFLNSLLYSPSPLPSQVTKTILTSSSRSWANRMEDSRCAPAAMAKPESTVSSA